MQRNIDSYEQGWKLIREFQQIWATEGHAWAFLQSHLLDVAKLVCAYSLIYPSNENFVSDDNLKEIFAWLIENTGLRQIFTSHDSEVNRFPLWLAARIRSTVRGKHSKRNFLYCLSCFGAAVQRVFEMSGVPVTAIIDDNRLGDKLVAKVPVMSLETVRLEFNDFEHAHFYVCHPSAQIFDAIKEKCVKSGVDHSRVIWIDAFSF